MSPTVKGTLALWYEPGGAPRGLLRKGAHRPKTTLHFNVWRDLSSSINFLDVGIRLSEAQDLKRLYLYVPAPLQLDQVSDLSRVMKFGRGLDAVFNQLINVTETTDASYRASDHTGEIDLVIHHFSVEDDLELEPIAVAGGESGTKVIFKEALCERLAHTSPHAYLRFRIQLRGPSRELFSSDIATNDALLSTPIDRQEITEFRLNEQRSYPAVLVRQAQANPLEIEAIHYFLIRNSRHQLLMHHAPLRKVRRLEPGLWGHYLKGEASDDQIAYSENLASQMIIYAWRERATAGEKLTDFIAFASFREPGRNFLLFVIGIVILGALAGLTGDLLAERSGGWICDRLGCDEGTDPWIGQLAGWSSLLAVFTLLWTVSRLGMPRIIRRLARTLDGLSS